MGLGCQDVITDDPSMWMGLWALIFLWWDYAAILPGRGVAWSRQWDARSAGGSQHFGRSDWRSQGLPQDGEGQMFSDAITSHKEVRSDCSSLFPIRESVMLCALVMYVNAYVYTRERRSRPPDGKLCRMSLSIACTASHGVPETRSDTHNITWRGIQEHIASSSLQVSAEFCTIVCAKTIVSWYKVVVLKALNSIEHTKEMIDCWNWWPQA